MSPSVSTSKGQSLPFEQGDTVAARPLPRRRADVHPVVQVPPATGPLLSDRRLPELPRDASTASPASQRVRPRSARDARRARERLAVGRARPTRHQRSAAAPASGRLLLQGADPPEVGSGRSPSRLIRRAAGLGAIDMTRRPDELEQVNHHPRPARRRSGRRRAGSRTRCRRAGRTRDPLRRG